MGELRLENGSIRFLGGTSNLLFNEPDTESHDRTVLEASDNVAPRKEDAIKSWTNVTDDPRLILHLLNLYFTWHYTYFTTLSKRLFLRDFKKGYRPTTPQPEYCAPVLVNAMLALGCHFTSWPAARSDPNDSSTVGDHFFKEAKRLVFDNDEFETPRLATVQALALMSVREAGCGREVRGWVYSGMSFRMAFDLGLNIETKGASTLDEQETDARRITFWGCFLFDKYVSVMLKVLIADHVTSGVGPTTLDDCHSYLCRPSPLRGSTSFRTRTRKCGLHGQTLDLTRHIGNLRGREPLRCRSQNSVRLAVISCYTSISRSRRSHSANRLR